MSAPSTTRPTTSMFAGGPSARRTPLAGRGEPMVWLTGAALALCLLLITSLLAMVILPGARAFWPRPLELVTLRAGETFLGQPMRDETFDPSDSDIARLQELEQAGQLPPDALSSAGKPVRRLYQVGNRELRGQPFRWVPVFEIAGVERPSDAVLLEREEWGVWLGLPKAIVRQELVTRPGPAESVEATGTVSTPDGPRRVERTVVRAEADGQVVVRERTFLAEGAADTLATFARLHGAARDRQDRMRALSRDAVGEINARQNAERLRLRRAELAHAAARTARAPALGFAGWGAVLAGALACLGLGLTRLRSTDARPGAVTRASTARTLATTTLLLLGCVGLLLATVERPWGTRTINDAALAEIRADVERQTAELGTAYEEVLARINEIDAEDARERIIVADATDGRFAPVRQTEPDEPLRVSQVVRAVQANELDALGRVGVYADRWREFLLDEPRDTNTAGGIFPVLFGTVLLTLLLSVAVVPLGVVAALYLREYATQGPLTSAIRIAVNNLAGVPSIVYGVFGLGFLCYTTGQFIDAGPSSPWSRAGWWTTVLVLVAAILAGAWLALASRPVPGRHQTGAQRSLAKAAGLAWVVCAGLAALLLSTTPYFDGFFRAKLPNPTFGTKGLLWSSLTLALLTLPVVIVATEEAIAAVPRSMREGSYGCGASKWQTIQRIVLPRAMPGIMTGMILAMARGAGEVAPLMLVGAVKLAPELPLTAEFPFLHLDRSFMHLGFHIYDLGFQSPDSEAARPLVWCTTLVLIMLVVVLNMTAIRIRSSLRRKYLGGAF